MNRNQHNFKILARQSDGCLERILRLVRHRGFDVNYFEAHENQHNNSLNVTLQLTSERNPDNLYYQLNKLVDIVEVHQAKIPSLRSCLGNEF